MKIENRPFFRITWERHNFRLVLFNFSFWDLWAARTTCLIELSVALHRIFPFKSLSGGSGAGITGSDINRDVPRALDYAFFAFIYVGQIAMPVPIVLVFRFF